MLKRIGILGGSDKLFQAAVKALQAGDTQVLKIDPESMPAPGTTSILVEAKSVTDAIPALLTVSHWNEELLHLVASAVDAREDIAPGSSRRLMNLAGRFAQVLGLSSDDQLTLERGALVRDIGKLRVPNSVLLKNGVLSYDEWCLLKSHPHQGEEVIDNEIPALRDTIDIVRNHHECFDGTGYPEGLEGEAIPYLARVIKILDVFCAMTSVRHYRSSVASVEEAIAHLRSEQGKHFDGKLVEAFLDSGLGKEV